MKQAVYVKTLEGWTGDARLYKMLPPLVEVGYDDPDNEDRK